SSAGVVTSTQTNTDNIRLDGNTISITDTNGNLTLTPNGNGNTEISKTKWKDWAAASIFYNYVPNNVNSYVVSDGGDSSWFTLGNNVLTAIKCELDGLQIIAPIPYESGTIMTRLRVKWQAVGDNDGVTVTLLKRDESGATSSFTTIGAAQTYTDPGTPYPVTVSTYDFADETMADNCSYSIAVDSVVAASGVYLYAVGVETSKRVY
ncbi:MAG: hypothetical protein KBA11_07780, partial [Sedimentibacter sp.]|nr:hypothetical protein [Sedimentibacter sp.]